MVPFGGWEMPVSYSGILEEHRRVRTHAGLFDVSHMGEFEISGPQAEAAVQYLTLNDVRALDLWQLQYSALCYDSGGILDDLTVCRLASDRFLLIVNAANIDKDFQWISAHLLPGAQLHDVSDSKALLALQGPEAEAILQRLTSVDLRTLAYYRAMPATVQGCSTLVARTGYTGEDGFEILLDAEQAVLLWQALLDAGHEHRILPAGLGARDTLRLEARYLLYGQDMDETTNPFEVGLHWITKLDKGDFLGRAALLHCKDTGVSRRLVGFVMAERGIPRPHQETSGTMSPSLGEGIGTALVSTAHAKVGSTFAIDVRNKLIPARVVPAPFVPRRVKR
jgi:aminomethyltransferase